MAIGLSALRAASGRARTGIYGSYIREQEDEATKRHKRVEKLGKKRAWSKLIGMGVGLGLAPFTGGMSLLAQMAIGAGAAGLTTYGLGRGKPKEIGPGKWDVASDILAEKEFGREREEVLMADIINSMLTGGTAPFTDWSKLGLRIPGQLSTAQRASDPFRNLQIFAQSGIPGIPTR